MKISARMISGADYEVDLLLVNIGRLAIEPDLPAALVVFVAACDHGKVAIRSLVVEWRAEWGDVFRPQRGKGPSHAGFAVSGCQIGVAGGANGRIHISVYRIR